ncbi:putative homoserine kinase [Piscirickettsia salmonis]|uniref:Regulatory protein n=1 Tax=Piscirickettsia salmonis TaxID=1238 RepID=A0AAC8ZNB8_PISSA|nr:hypothetical protein [Piscirickettsia salmonis]ALB21525.1 regulatory protein [Piscirickettsia salmonis]QGN99855.1 putative homoserine kinase [Piscirickettsia salmonis]QGO03506.1 putative homoserine kinase [Piscirickettsia salmonis]QGO14137.1 putative homoserine kinase [Piscirickettsia salmonis]QGO21234.1 putative homoserine kinase [Piscirickettsia salmonis]
MKVIIPMLLAGDHRQQQEVDQYCPALLALLSYARQVPSAQKPIAELFASLSCLPLSLERDLPLAAATAKGYSLPVAAGWLYADLVSISADQNGLYCHGSLASQLTDQEKSLLLDELNQFLAEDGLILYDCDQHWLLAAAQPVELLTRDLTSAQGQSVQIDEITGADAKYWRSLQAELGMLLQQSTVNQRRRDQGFVTVDTVWLWGSGQLLSADYPLNHTRVLCSESKLAQGLGQFCGAKQGASHALGQGVIYYNDCCQQAVLAGDDRLWQRTLVQLESQVFKPLLQQLKRGQLKQLELFIDQNIVFSVTHWGVKKFWCRPKSVQSYRNGN